MSAVHTEASDSGRERPSRPRGVARRNEILEVALRLFGARGFNDVGIAEIAGEVGITQAGLLHHFPSKAALLMAVLQEREDRNAVEQEHFQAEGHDPIETFLHTLESNEASPALVQLFAVLSAESIAESHPSHGWFVDRYDLAVSQMTVEVGPLLDPVRLPPGITAETVARWLIGLADGLRIQWLLQPGAMNRHESVAQFVALLDPFLKKPRIQPGANATET